MSNSSDADPEHVAQLYAELLQLFEQARQLQTQSAHLLSVAHQDSGYVLGRAVGPEPDTPAAATLSPEETLDTIITLLAECSFETQVNIMKTLALGIASQARARADIKHPPTA
jgi:hypothetical protein